MKKIILIIVIFLVIELASAYTCDTQQGGPHYGAKVYFTPYDNCEPKLSIDAYSIIKNINYELIAGVRPNWSKIFMFEQMFLCSPKFSSNFNSNSYIFYLNPLNMKVTNIGIHDFTVYKGQEIIIANEVEGEWGTGAEEETPWQDSPPIYFSGSDGVVCDATIKLIDNGKVVKEIKLSESSSIEYTAEKLGVHYIETVADIKSCSSNFKYTIVKCPAWDLMLRRNEYVEPSALYGGKIITYEEFVELQNVLENNNTNNESLKEQYESIKADYHRFYGWPIINVEDNKIIEHKFWPIQSKDAFHSTKRRILDMSGDISLPSNLQLHNDAFIIEVKEPSPDLKIGDIKGIILPSGEKPPEHLINLWEKI